MFLFFFIILCIYRFFFFFSSRRRHTRSLRDWSSDVCSSDLEPETEDRTDIVHDGQDDTAGSQLIPDTRKHSGRAHEMIEHVDERDQVKVRIRERDVLVEFPGVYRRRQPSRHICGRSVRLNSIEFLKSIGSSCVQDESDVTTDVQYTFSLYQEWSYQIVI